MKMKFKAIVIILLTMALFKPEETKAQYQEWGFWLGSSTYFGDLNTDVSLRGTRPAGGFIFRHYISPYLALRGGLNAGFVSFKDEFSKRSFQQVRNLNFRTHIIELSAQVEFNFNQFIPGNENYYWSPYLTMGFSMFHFSPKTTDDEGNRVNLREIGTEGQHLNHLTGNKPYSLFQPAIPVGFGLKYWFKNNITFGFEVGYRFTFTDYLDDVKTIYYSESILNTENPNTSDIADRSGDPRLSNIEGKQRGDSVSNDSFIFAGVTLTFAIFKVKCPNPVQ